MIPPRSATVFSSRQNETPAPYGAGVSFLFCFPSQKSGYSGCFFMMTESAARSAHTVT